MKIIENLNEFIEKVDAMKKVNPLDLSSDQDLTIAIMNLISIEEHLFFTGAKTQDNSFYDLINVIREDRKELLKKIIKNYKGEVWCISKHLLAASMRLMEVATKALGADKKEEAYDFFNKAYNLYCLFWGLNINSTNENKIDELVEKYNKDKETTEYNEKNSVENSEHLTCNRKQSFIENNIEGNKIAEKPNFFTKFKNFVSKNVDCCKE